MSSIISSTSSPIIRFIKGILFVALITGTIFYAIYEPGIVSDSIHDELEAIYPDSLIKVNSDSLFTDVPVGGIAAAHITIWPSGSGKKIRYKVKGISRKLKNNISWYQLLDVPVPENTGLDSRTEKFSGQINPYVIRKAPFNIFEVLKPVTKKLVSQSADKSLALRIEIPITKEFPVGTTEIMIQLGEFPGLRELFFTIQVHEVNLPTLENSSLAYVNWHSNDRICSDHKVEKWSDEFWKTLDSYAAMMAKGRQNTFWFHWADYFELDSSAQIVDFHAERFQQYIQTFLDRGLTIIQGAPFTRRIDWSTDGMLVSLPQIVNKQIYANSEEGLILISKMFESIKAEMATNGWTNQWLQGIFDEPTEQYTERYKNIADILHTAMPDLRILEATMTTSLVGYVDAWCPQVHEFQNNIDFFDERKNEGDQVWVYTCLVPGGPWINRLVDQERLRSVYVGWAASHYDLDGFLHWGFNHHRGKPFEELVVQHGDATNYLPAGDSHIVYPGENEPWSSQRFEAHRIGMEDYELLKMLKDKDPSKAASITGKLFRAFDDYEKEVAQYRIVRKELLEYLGN